MYPHVRAPIDEFDSTRAFCGVTVEGLPKILRADGSGCVKGGVGRSVGFRSIISRKFSFVNILSLASNSLSRPGVWPVPSACNKAFRHVALKQFFFKYQSFCNVTCTSVNWNWICVLFCKSHEMILEGHYSIDNCELTASVRTKSAC